MRKSSKYFSIFAVVLFASSVLYVPQAQASPYDYWRIYYDANQNEVGWYHFSPGLPNGHPEWDGEQDGVWIEVIESGPGYSTTTYYYNCSGLWVEVSYIGQTASC